MTRFQAVHAIRALAAEGKIKVAAHAALRMTERGIAYDGLVHALTNLKQAIEQQNGRWRCTGPGLTTEPVQVIVAIEENAIVITLWEIAK